MSFTKSISNQIYTIRINLEMNTATIYRGRDSGLSDTKPIFDEDGKLDYTVGSLRYYIELKDGCFFDLNGKIISRQFVIEAVSEVITDICKKLERKIKPKISISEKEVSRPSSFQPKIIRSVVSDFREGKKITLECKSGVHDKFWAAMSTSPTSYIRTWGKIGLLTPQSKEFNFMATEDMIKDFEHELIAKLTKKEDPYTYVGSSK